MCIRDRGISPSHGHQALGDPGTPVLVGERWDSLLNGAQTGRHLRDDLVFGRSSQEHWNLPGWVGKSSVVSNGARHQLSESLSAFAVFCICGGICVRRTTLLPRVEIWAASPSSTICLPLCCQSALVKISPFSNHHRLYPS